MWNPTKFNIARLDQPAASGAEKDFVKHKMFVRQANFVNQPITMTNLCCPRNLARKGIGMNAGI